MRKLTGITLWRGLECRPKNNPSPGIGSVTEKKIRADPCGWHAIPWVIESIVSE